MHPVGLRLSVKCPLLTPATSVIASTEEVSVIVFIACAFASPANTPPKNAAVPRRKVRRCIIDSTLFALRRGRPIAVTVESGLRSALVGASCSYFVLRRGK